MQTFVRLITQCKIPQVNAKTSERKIFSGKTSLVEGESSPWILLQMDITSVVPDSSTDPTSGALVTSFYLGPFSQKEVAACRLLSKLHLPLLGSQLSHYLVKLPLF